MQTVASTNTRFDQWIRVAMLALIAGASSWLVKLVVIVITNGADSSVADAVVGVFFLLGFVLLVSGSSAVGLWLSGPTLELETRAGELTLVPEPAGTRGYDDLRRRASREPLGRGLRPQIASPADLARMLGALGREDEIDTLLRLRRLLELESRVTLDRDVAIEL